MRVKVWELIVFVVLVIGLQVAVVASLIYLVVVHWVPPL